MRADEVDEEEEAGRGQEGAEVAVPWKRGRQRGRGMQGTSNARNRQ